MNAEPNELKPKSGSRSEFDEWFARVKSTNQNRKHSIRNKNERKILEAAEIQFAKEGFRGTTIGNIAERAGLPRANVMYYFASKEEIYRTVLYSMCLTWEGPANTFSKYSDPKEAMTTYIRAKMQLSRDRPYGSKVWANEVLRGADMVEPYLREHLMEWIESRSEIFHHWMNLGLIQQIDPETLLYSIWATTQHYADFSDQLCILNGGKPYSDEQYEEKTNSVIQLFLRGMGLE